MGIWDILIRCAIIGVVAFIVFAGIQQSRMLQGIKKRAEKDYAGVEKTQ